MSYNKHNWVTGETITAQKLNHIEDELELLSQSDSDATDADCDALFDGFLEVEEDE